MVITSHYYSKWYAQHEPVFRASLPSWEGNLLVVTLTDAVTCISRQIHFDPNTMAVTSPALCAFVHRSQPLSRCHSPPQLWADESCSRESPSVPVFYIIESTFWQAGLLLLFFLTPRLLFLFQTCSTLDYCWLLVMSCSLFIVSEKVSPCLSAVSLRTGGTSERCFICQLINWSAVLFSQTNE